MADLNGRVLLPLLFLKSVVALSSAGRVGKSDPVVRGANSHQAAHRLLRVLDPSTLPIHGRWWGRVWVKDWSHGTTAKTKRL